jgi:hypothetical protein
MYLVLLGTGHFGLDFLDFVNGRHVGQSVSCLLEMG